jgi:predicted DNA-binding transcriptional regulator AlpA
MPVQYLTAGDVARHLTVAESTLKTWRHRGEGPRWVRLGRRRIAYPLPDFEAWQAEQVAATARAG